MMRFIRSLIPQCRGAQLRFNRAMLTHLEVVPRHHVYVTLEPDGTIRVRALHRVPPEELVGRRTLPFRRERRLARVELARRAALPPRSAPETPRTDHLARLFAQTRRQLRRRLDT